MTQFHFVKTSTPVFLRSSLQRIFLLLAFFSLCFAASVSAQYAVSNTGDFTISGGVNNATGAIIGGAGNGLITLRSAITAADNTGGTRTITLAPGTYNLTQGEIISGNQAENITITGTGGAGATIINMTATATDRILLLNPPGTISGVVTSFNGLTFQNGKLTSDIYGGGAVISGGPLNVTTFNNCVFINNSIDPAAGTTGGAINNSGGGILAINSCTFTNNTNPVSDGGAVYYFFQNFPGLTGQLNINSSTFNGNAATVSGGSGGAVGIALQGRIAPFNQTFSSNITGCTFINNTANSVSGTGGAISVDNGDAAYNINIHYNRITNNTSTTAATSGLSMATASGGVNATDNWWGSNIGPAAVGAGDNAGVVGGGSGLVLTTWLQLKSSASVANVCTGATSLVTASFLSNSAGTAVSTGNLTALIGQPITFNAAGGTLSGAQTTIQSSGTATVTFTAGAVGGNATVNAVVDVTPNNDATAKATIFVSKPTVVNPATTTGTVNAAFSQTFTGATGVGPYTFTTSSTLPAGLTFSSAGVLSGTPTVPGTFPITVNVTDNITCTGTSAVYNLVIACQTITVTNPVTTTGTVGTAFSQTFNQTNGVGTTNFSLNSGTLPTGLSLSTGGVLSGTPTQSGTFNITVRATDANLCFGNGATYTLVISCQTITVTNPATATGTNGTAFSQSFSQTGALGGATFSLNSGTIPNGLTLSAAGVLSGTPSVPAGTYPITVKVTDGNGCTGISPTYNLVISCQTITVTNPVVTSGGLSVPFSQTFSQTGGSGSPAFTLNSGSLPGGLTLATNGTLSGTPTATGTFPITVKVTDANGCTGIGATYNLNIAVSPCTVNQVALIGTPASVFHTNTITGFNVPGGTNRVLLVTASDANSTTITSVTYNGTPMVQQIFKTDATAVDAIYTLALGTSLTPSTGNIVVTSGSTDQFISASVFESVNQTSPISASASAFGSVIPSTSSLTITGAANDLGFDLFDYWRPTTTPNSASFGGGQTAIVNQGPLTITNAGAGFGYWSTSRKTGAASLTMSRATTDGNAMIHLIVNIKSAPATVITVTNPSNAAGTVNVPFSENFTASGGATPYTFTTSSSLPAGITLAANGTLSGTPTASGTFPVIVKATDANGCFANGATYTLVISACPVITVTNPAATTGTAGTAFSQSFSASGGATPYSYSTASTLPTGLTLSAAGVLSGTPTQAGTFPIVVTATDNNTCTGNSSTYNLVIGCPAPVTGTATPSSQSTCSGGAITTIVLAGAPAGAAYNWTRDNNVTATGIAANGTGNISGTLTNTGTAPVTVTFTITPSYYSTCNGTPYTATVTVNPIPAVTQVAPQTLCAGAASTAINFSSTATGGTIVYNWTETNPVIGITPTGTGNIPSFTAINAGTTVVTDTIKVTASYTNGSSTCTSPVMLFVITVNPNPTVNTVTDQTVCNGSPVSAVTFSGTVPGTVYSWTNNNTGTGLAAGGTGNIASFTGTNATTAPITSAITVTPAFYNQSIMGSIVAGDLSMPSRLFRDGIPAACPSKAFPGTSAGAHLYDTYNFTNTTGQAQCVTITYNAKSTGDVFVSAYNGSFNPASLSTNYLGDGGLSSIGGSVSSFSVNVAAGATMVLVANEANSAPCPVYVISISGIGLSCTGTPKTFNITVNPTATVTAVADQEICNGTSSTAINFSSPTTGGSVSYSWTNNNTAIGLGASGNGNIPSFTGTNATNAPISATITVTPTYTNNAVTCAGTPSTFTITVDPTPVVNAVTSQVVCNGAPTTAVNFTGPVAGTTFNWTNNTTSIGLAASGTGNIASFNGINTGTSPVTATITVTPVVAPPSTVATFNYTGSMQTFTVPAGVTSISIDAAGAEGGTGAVGTGGNGGTGGKGSKSSGTLAVTPGQVLNIFVGGTATGPTGGFNGGGNGGTLNAGGGGGASDVRYPGTTAADRIIVGAGGGGGGRAGCNTTATGGNGGDGGGNGTKGTDASTSGGFAGGGFPAAGATGGVKGIGCAGFSGVDGATTANETGGNGGTGQICCCPSQPGGGGGGGGFLGGGGGGGGSAGTTACSGNDKGGGGGGAGGTNYTGGVTAGANANGIQTGNGVVTISYTLGGTTCTGTPTTFTITVNPTPTVNTVANQVVCNGAPTAAVNFTGPVAGTTFNWTNNTTSIGLAASGTGNIASFNGINTGTAPVTATVTVTPVTAPPVATFNYTGSMQTFTVPAGVTSITIDSYGAEGGTGAVGTGGNGGTGGKGSKSSGTLAVTPGQVLNIFVGGTATGPTGGFNGGGNGGTLNAGGGGGASDVRYPGTTAADRIIVGAGGGGGGRAGCNTTATGGNGGDGGGNGTKGTDASTSGGFAGGGFPAAGATGGVKGIGCAGFSGVDGATTANETGGNGGTGQICCCPSQPGGGGGGGGFLGGGGGGGGSAGTTACTGNDKGGGGGGAGGTNYTGGVTAGTNTNGVQSGNGLVVITFGAAGSTCTGTPTTFTITVNPTPTVNTVANQVVCNGSPVTAINFSGAVPGTVYNWTNNNTSIGLGASGNTNIASFNGINTGNAPVTATITVTPTYTNGGTTCTGTSTTFTITVNPTPAVNTVANQVVCNGSSVSAINFSGAVPGTVYNWTNNNTSIGLGASGSGNIASFAGTNATNAPVTATITVTPAYTNGAVTCSGTPITFTITVNPTPTVNTVANQIVCNGSPVSAINFSGFAPGTVYNWTNNNTSIGLGASGNTNIASFNGINTGAAPVTATITVTPTYTNGGTTCTGTPTTFTITVNPTPVVNTVANQVVCNGAPTAAVNFTGPVAGTVYNWTNNTTSIGLAASGTGNIASFNGINTGTAPVTATVTVTPMTGPGPSVTTFNYTGAMQTFTVPAGVTSITIDASGASGRVGSNGTGGIGGAAGKGSKASGTLAVTPGQVLNIFVGGTTVSSAGGYNGGGSGGAANAGGGGGASDVRYPGTTAADRIIVGAGGGGGASAGCNTTATGGNGGDGGGNGTKGTDASTSGGFAGGGFPAAGATGGVKGIGCAGFSGVDGATTANETGGNGGTGQICCCPSQPGGGGGGGGFLGGGGGGGGSAGTTACTGNDKGGGGGGAGGTNYTGGVTAGTTTNGVQSGDGVVTISFVPVGVTCTGTPTTFTITVNPTPTVNTVANQVVCNGSPVTAINFSGAVPGTVYNWTNNNTSIGLGASGNTNIASFNGINTGTAPVTATITVTPTYTNGGTTCTGTSTTFTITVNPTATINAVSNQVVCNGANTTAVTFSSPTTGGTIVYNWTNNTPSIGLASSGSGNIASFVATNAGNAPVTAAITVTPAFTNGAVTCNGTPVTFTITVNPTATVTAVANQTVCNGSATAAVNFTSPTTGGSIVYNWTNNNTSIGLAAGGSGNIASFNGINTGTAPVTATITVTPSYTNGAVTCIGTPRTFTITVNPTAVTNFVANQTVCNGAPTTAITFSSTATGGSIVYNWTNNNTSIGLASGGTGNIASFNGVNPTNAPVTATITVTAAFTNNGVTCNGTPITFTITVNPTPTVNAVANQTVCNGSATTAVSFTGFVPGTVYNWTNSDPSIGLTASGTGDIASFIGVNAGNAPVTAAITVTPSYTNSVTTCLGAPITFTITVNPTATVNAVANQTVCNGSPTTAVTISGPVAGAVYNWTNNNPAIGLGASGTGTVPSFNGSNNGLSPVTATITVTPTYTNGGVTCTGPSSSFTITVNPAPSVISVPNQVVCNNSATTGVTFSSSATGGTIVYNWTNNNTSIGLAAGGTGSVPSFIAANAANAPVTATITVIASYTNNGVTCTGPANGYTITVNPTPAANAVANQAVCNGAGFVPFALGGSVPGAQYFWTNNNTSIGLGAGGSGTIPTFIATNPTNAPVTATITVTPSYTNGGTTCTGTPVTFTITVNPTPVANAIANQAVCVGSASSPVPLNGTVSGTVYTWTNNNTAIGLGAGGTGTIPPFTGTNTTNAPITGIITVTASYTNAGITCTGAPVTFSITINPIPAMNAVVNQTVCNGGTTSVSFVSNVSGAVYSWTNNTPSIGIGASGTGNIPVFTAVNTGTAPVTATFTVTPSYATCSGTPITFTITVNPSAAIATQPANTAVCEGLPATFTVAATGVNLTYQWQVNTGAGFVNIPSANAASYSTVPVTTLMNGYLYRVIAGSACGTVTSAAATLTVNTAPVFTVQPVNTTGCIGGSVTFTSTAFGTGVGFQWEVNTGSGFLPVAGATSQNYTVTGLTAAMNGYQYHVIATGVCAPGATSNTVTLTVNAPTIITAQPASVSVCQGLNAVFSVSATGTALTYQWQVNTGSGFVNIPGATSATLTLTAPPVSASGNQYRVIVTGLCGPVISATATLTVFNLDNIDLSAIQTNVCYSDTVITLKATPAGGVWSGNGISGNLFDPKAAGIGVSLIKYTVSNANGCVSVREIAVTVTSCPERLGNLEYTLSLYPNPNHGQFAVRLLSDIHTELNLTIVDAAGRIIKRWKATGLHYGSLIPVDLRTIASGTYRLMADDKGDHTSKGFVVLP